MTADNCPIERTAGFAARHRWLVNLGMLFTAVFILLVTERQAAAVPSFARKYNTSCQTCHTAFPVLNPFGEAFRRNGFRFPSVGGSEDGDAAKEEPIAMGQEEQDKTFPNSVWSDRISPIPPLSMEVQGGLYYALPNSDYRKSLGHGFTWDGIVGPVSLFAAGSFSDRITCYVKMVATPAATVKVSAAYLVWNDIVGPRHILNLWIGRLIAPQLTSFGVNGSYVSDKAFPLVSVAGLFNPNVTPTFGAAPVDGAELNGIALHRISYAAGWLASTVQSGLTTPTAEDVYLHVGAKFGGMSLDGEGDSGMGVANPEKPWSETSFTFDTFAYHGVIVADNYINYPATTAQRSAVETLGHALRLHVKSFALNGIFQYQLHHRPYPGTPPTAANPPDLPNSLPGVPDNRKGRGFVAAGEMSYVVFPWLVPAVRAEFTLLDSDWGRAPFLRILPGASVLLRPNMRLYLYGDVEYAKGLPPSSPQYPGTWGSASGFIEPHTGKRKTEVEQIYAAFSWAL